MPLGATPSTSNLPPLPSCLGNRRAFLPPPGTVLPRLSSVTHDAVVLQSGLTTPPVDDMSTTYQAAPATYENHGLRAYPPSSLAPTPGRPIDVPNDPRNSHYYRYPSQQKQQQQQQQQQLPPLHPHAQLQLPLASNAYPQNAAPSAIQPVAASQLSGRPSTPSPEAPGTMPRDATASRRGSETLIYHSLQIPKCISPNGGNLATFAAQMTCLFWFQSSDELKQAETIQSRPPQAPVSRLSHLANPHEQFRKWVYTVLSTTQVTQNVILLALLFIYRLKMSTPQIKGRGGSEYRLLTVALMLGNKFLDDNTYTNKTWAEVSCFTVQEIHVMEVEFLSNMRYNLLASKDEWEDWLVKLACFHEYYDRASRVPLSPIHVPSPTTNPFSSPLPSPTGAVLPSMPDAGVMTPSSSAAAAHNWPPHHGNATSPLAAKPTINLPPTSRKRSTLEDDPSEHPAKRAAPPRSGQLASHGTTARPTAQSDSTRLPVPQLSLVTNPAPNGPPSFAPAGGYSTPTNGASSNLVSLPPLQPGMRAMSTVYQQPSVSMVQPPSVPATSGPATLAPTQYHGAPAPANGAIGFGTPSKHHNLTPFASSPMAEPFGPGSGVHTPMSHTPIANSPIAYLQQRTSPYRPIRHVNTLLYPAPSASLDQYHLSVPVQPTQMHYQPLGRRNDLRTGVVPEFVMYNRGQHAPLPSQGTPQGHYPS